MTDPREHLSPDRSGTPPPDRSGPPVQRPSRLLVTVGLILTLSVFVAGAVWSFEEQTALARSTGFQVPWLLPLTIDGFAVAMAAVAWAASLDGRTAVFARVGIVAGIASSATANAAAAWQRSGAETLTVTLGAVVPIAAMIAFEVLLSEARKQVQRHRGLPGPEPVPRPRAVRMLHAPWSTYREWRGLMLDRTAPWRQFEAVKTAQLDRPVGGQPTGQDAPPEPVVRPVRTGATVTPINRSGPGRPARGRGRRTGRTGMRLTDHTPVAIEDAEAVLDRFGDDIPARETVRVAMGWGSPKTGNALKAVPAVRAARRERSANGQTDRSESDTDKEPEVAFA